MKFDDIMNGFIKAQSAAIKRGDFTPSAGLDYLNGVNDALAAQLEDKDSEQNSEATHA